MTRKKGAKWKYAAAGIIIFVITALCIPSSRLLLFHVFSRKPVCLECGHGHVIHDYYEATGISKDTRNAFPAEVVKIYGEPERIKTMDKGRGTISEIYVYSGFGIMFQPKDPDIEKAEECKSIAFVLYSPDIKIRRDIHVGSTRRQIIHAYRKCPDVPELDVGMNHEKIKDSFHDLSIWNAEGNCLSFSYDENDIVTSIEYYP